MPINRKSHALGISRRELARRAGISEAAVRKHVAFGALAGALLPDGSLDAAKAIPALAKVITRGKLAAAGYVKAQDRFTLAQVDTLRREVEELQRSYVPILDAERITRENMAEITSRLASLPEAAKPMAGLPARDVHSMLKDRVHAALESISTHFLGAHAAGQEDRWWDEPISKPKPPLTGTALKSAKLNLSAVKIEIENSIAAGEVRAVQDIVSEAGERTSIAKSLLLAIPGRVAEKVSAATPEEARALVAAEVATVVAELTS